MVNPIATHVASKFSLAFSDNPAFNNPTANSLFDLDQLTEENLSNSFDIAGAVADQVVDLGNINSPTFVVIIVESEYIAVAGPKAIGDPAQVQFKVGSGTIFDANFMAFIVDVDANTGTVTQDIKITTLADTRSTVKVFVAGAKA